MQAYIYIFSDTGDNFPLCLPLSLEIVSDFYKPFNLISLPTTFERVIFNALIICQLTLMSPIPTRTELSYFPLEIVFTVELCDLIRLFSNLSF